MNMSNDMIILLSSYSLKCFASLQRIFPRCPRTKMAAIINSTRCKTSPVDTIPTVCAQTMCRYFLSHRWYISPIFPLRTECSLQDSSWAPSFHLSRRQDRMFQDPSNYRPITNLVHYYQDPREAGSGPHSTSRTRVKAVQFISVGIQTKALHRDCSAQSRQ